MLSVRTGDKWGYTPIKWYQYRLRKGLMSSKCSPFSKKIQKNSLSCEASHILNLTSQILHKTLNLDSYKVYLKSSYQTSPVWPQTSHILPSNLTKSPLNLLSLIHPLIHNKPHISSIQSYISYFKPNKTFCHPQTKQPRNKYLIYLVFMIFNLTTTSKNFKSNNLQHPVLTKSLQAF